VSERELQAAIIDTARLLGWRVAHFRPAMTEKGWRTAVAADGAGFPDLVLVKGPRLLFAELKSKVGVASQSQSAWLGDLGRTAAEVHLWRPADWSSGAIEAVLRGR
jgi:hypothetical protein